MATVTFEADVRPIFEKEARYLACMRHQTVATEAGAYECDLTDYEIVKKLHEKILWVIDDAWTDGEATSYQAMPAGMKQLPAENIETFKAWIEQGMIEK